MKEIKKQVQDYIYSFFIKSLDFNGIPLRHISHDLEITYEESIDIVKELVAEDKCMIQSSTNPHIIYWTTYSISSELSCLENAKKITVELCRIGDIEFESENTEFPICVYPSQSYLRKYRDVGKMSFFTKLLSLGEPQLTPCYFDMDVLQRYYDDPRYHFYFKGYTGRISFKEKDGESMVRKEDEVFLKSFGLGYDNSRTRIVVAYLRYLNDLTPEHQNYWQSKMVHPNREPRILNEYYENTINGNWVTSESVYSAFQCEVNTVIDLSQQIFGKPLFREKISLENPPKELSFFFLPTKKNFNAFVLAMDQMISDNINRDFFSGKVALEFEKEREDGKIIIISKGTLTLLIEWLKQTINTTFGSVDELIKPFKNIRKLRQKPAHSLITDEYCPDYFDKQKEIIWEAYCSMKNLRLLLSNHPNANKELVPSWLDTTEIKNY